MHVGKHLRTLSATDRAACPTHMRQAVAVARAPIEAWRQGEIGQRLERQLSDAMTLQDQDKILRFADLLTHHKSWLPSYVSALFNHAATDFEWQPPLSDFAASGHSSLFLIERADLKLSLVLLHPDPLEADATPPVIRLTSGHIMLCPVANDGALAFRRWDFIGDTLTPCSTVTLTSGDAIHCQLSRRFMQPTANTTPMLLLRLEWPEDVFQADRFYSVQSGTHLAHMIGSDGFRRHMALSVLNALCPHMAVSYLPNAIEDAPDDGLAWHYTRLLLASAPDKALPILMQQAAGGSDSLRRLAGQTLAVLRTHYPPLFEAA